MKLPQLKVSNKRIAAIAVCAASLASSWAQQVTNPVKATASPSSPPAQATTPSVPQRKEVEAQPALDSGDSDTIMLSPFEVIGDNKGYQAYNSASGTRLNSKLEDIASPISVVTKQQLQDMAAVDINDIFRSETNVEGLYQYSEGFDDGRGFLDVASTNPEANNRIRGMGQANITANGMSVSAAIPIDAYNIDSLEISRGANSNIFGIGSTSGTVNLNVATGNMSKDVSKLSFMTDNLGRARGTFDFNRVLIRNKLAIRVLGANDELGFEREPSFSKTKRFTIAARAQPFKRTSLKASYETYRVSESLPNRFTPRDGITPWLAAGGNTWDPSTFTVYNSANVPGATYFGTTSTTATNGALALYRDFGFRNGPGGTTSGGDSRMARPMVGYIDGQIAYFTQSHAYRFNRRRTGAGFDPAGTNEYINDGNIRMAQYELPAVRIYVPDINPATGQPYGFFTTDFRDAAPPMRTEADKAIYDWTKYNLNASNHAEKASNIFRFEVEQDVFNTDFQRLAFQVGGLYEDIESKAHNFIGNSGDGPDATIFVDINRTLPNGSPNPGYLRPHIRGQQQQVYYRPEENLTHKAQLAYLIDFTKNQGWSKWIGSHNFVGYSEYREKRFVRTALRYRGRMPNHDGLINPINLSDSTYGHYYLGDASGYNVDSVGGPPPATGVFPYTYWSTEFGPTGAVSPGAAQFRQGQGQIFEQFFSGLAQKNEIRSQGFLWQGHLFEDRIVPTFGYRKDKTRFMDANPNIGTAAPGNGFTIGGSEIFYEPTVNLFEFRPDYKITNPLAGKNENSGVTRTQGVVLKPFRGFTKSSFLDGISFTYNRSASFEPSDLAVDTYGEIVPDPTGKSEDYGIRFSLMDERLYISINKYEATTINSRNNGANAINGRAIGFDRDVAEADADSAFGGVDSGTQADLFDWYFFRIYGQTGTIPGQPAGTVPPPFSLSTAGATVGQPTGDPVYATQNGLIGTTDAETQRRVTDHVYGLMKYDKELVRKYAQANTRTAVNDVTSKGYEMEILYRTKNWNLKVTGAKQQTIDSNLASSLGRYITEREPVLSSATYTNLTRGTPTESFWNTPASGTTATRGDVWRGNVLGSYNILVANLGKPRSQVREYSTAVTTSYNLAGITNNDILRRIRVGGGATWASKASIGYGYAQPQPNPQFPGVYTIYGYDPAKPYYDRSRYTANAWTSYEFRMFSGRIKSSLQLNVQNLLEDGRLQRTKVRGDGVGVYYRIIDPRLYQLTLNMEL